jgi:hypothetical protein
MSASFKRAMSEIIAIPDCEEKTYSSGGCALFQTPLFYIRLLDNEDVEIHLAERETFDRWANSVNFHSRRTKERRLYYPLFRPQYDWAIKVLKSKLFNFNSYIESVDLPWFECLRNP